MRGITKGSWGLLLAVAGLAWVSTPACGEGPKAAGVDFNRQVRPILSENCYACHGPDAKTRKGGLRLDIREGAFAEGKSGERAVVAGKSVDSALVARITATDSKELMPPPKSGKKLTPAQVAILKEWIDQGAKWAEHWAFVAPTRPHLPAVKDAAWVRNPIDRFVLARLEREGLKPSAEVDRTTLIRRLTLDLTGLPPTPAEVAAFVADGSPDAYEKVVDRLLRSPRYGERMAMPWLDGARYADSNGYQADYERFMWRWRDWVIDAFNANKPFDQFTIEQLAGDLLPEATREQRLATGFHRNHRINTEGGIIAEEWRIETVVDRVETTGSVWLGLTLNCARCHDHKYDPIAQKEFYRLFAFFNNVPESGVGAEQPVNHPPVMPAPRKEDEAGLRERDEAVARAKEQVKRLEARLPALQAEWEKTAAGKLPAGTRWHEVAPAEATAEGQARLGVQPDRSVIADGPNADRETYTLKLSPGLPEVTAVRLELLPRDGLAGRGPGRSVNGNVVLTGVKVQADGRDVKLASASADFSQDGYPVAAAIDNNPAKGWAIFPRVGQAHTAVFGFDQPVKAGSLTVRLEFHSGFAGHQPGHFRVAVTDSKKPHEAGGVPAAVVAALGSPADRRTPEQAKALAEYFRAHHAGELTGADRKLQQAVKAREEFEARLPTVMVMAELPQPRDAFVLLRGQYDKKGEKVTAGLPSVLPPLPEGVPVNRLGLAKWVADPANPLTARVAVNRLWEKFFGLGLVKSSENFGAQGEPPSHPELLDWLATEFVRLGWDLKATHKTIVMSATYRQTSAVTPALLARDPENRLLARASRFRLSGELVRDNALAVSGLLLDKVGGPSVRPYQPQGVWDETNVYGNLRNYQHDKGEGLYRRSLYTIWKRTAAPPTMLLFDSPSRELCTVKRARTNTPLQALALLNEVTYVEAARALAMKAIREGGSTSRERVRHAFRRAVARQPSEAELRVLTEGLNRRLAKYRAEPEAAKKLLAVGDLPAAPGIDPAELAAYTMTASVLLNLDETITRE